MVLKEQLNYKNVVRKKCSCFDTIHCSRLNEIRNPSFPHMRNWLPAVLEEYPFSWRLQLSRCCTHTSCLKFLSLKPFISLYFKSNTFCGAWLLSQATWIAPRMQMGTRGRGVPTGQIAREEGCSCPQLGLSVLWIRLQQAWGFRSLAEWALVLPILWFFRSHFSVTGFYQIGKILSQLGTALGK